MYISSNAILVLVLLQSCDGFSDVTNVRFEGIVDPYLDTDVNQEYSQGQAIQPQILDFNIESESSLSSERGITCPDVSPHSAVRSPSKGEGFTRAEGMNSVGLFQEWIDLLHCLSIWSIRSL